MGRVWDALGRLLATFERILGAFWRFLDVQNRIFFKHGSKMSSKRPLGSILGRFWKVLGGFGEGLGRNWGGFWKDLGTFAQVVGRLWTYLETCGPAGAESLNRTPALIRSASQCAGPGLSSVVGWNCLS